MFEGHKVLFLHVSISFISTQHDAVGPERRRPKRHEEKFSALYFSCFAFFFESEYQAEKRWCPAIWSITSGVFGVSRKATTDFVPLLQWKSQPCAEHIFFSCSMTIERKTASSRGLWHIFFFSFRRRDWNATMMSQGIIWHERGNNKQVEKMLSVCGENVERWIERTNRAGFAIHQSHSNCWVDSRDRRCWNVSSMILRRSCSMPDDEMEKYSRAEAAAAAKRQFSEIASRSDAIKVSQIDASRLLMNSVWCWNVAPVDKSGSRGFERHARVQRAKEPISWEWPSRRAAKIDKHR